MACAAVLAAQSPSEPLYPNPIDVNPPHISTDASVKYDYDIAYVRTPRLGDKERSYWAEIAHPGYMDARGDLMLLHPDGSEERLVEGGADGAVADPAVSFDGQWIYYAHLRGLGESAGTGPGQKRADIFKIHVRSRQIVRLTQQTFTPNTGVGNVALPVTACSTWGRSRSRQPSGVRQQSKRVHVPEAPMACAPVVRHGR